MRNRSQPSANVASCLILAAPPPLTQHPAAVYLSGLSEGSRSTMRQALDAISALLTDGRGDALTLDWAALRYQHTAAIRTALVEQFAPATANKMLCALRRVLKEALRLDLIDATDYAKAVDIPSVKAAKGLRGRALSANEIAALMAVCFADPTPQGARDAALIAILRGAGLRRAEVVKLELRDFTASTGSLEVRGGKGGKDRTVYLSQVATSVVEDWLAIRGKSPGPLLCPIRKGGRVESEAIAAGDIQQAASHLDPDADFYITPRLPYQEPFYKGRNAFVNGIWKQLKMTYVPNIQAQIGEYLTGTDVVAVIGRLAL